jgi:signal peptidase II
VQEHGAGSPLTSSSSSEPAGATTAGDDAAGPTEARNARLISLRRRLLVAAAAGVAALDQLTKQLALSHLKDGDAHVAGSLRFRLEFNTGSAFSVGSGRGGLIGLLAIGMVLAMLWLARDVRGRVQALALGLVLGGAISNLADRVLRDGSGFLGGAVVDFVDLQWWPVFNLADSAIVVGAILLALTWGKPAAGTAP